MRCDTIRVLKASGALSAQLAAIVPASRKVNPVFMEASLPELSFVEVYVIHQMHLADVFPIR